MNESKVFESEYKFLRVLWEAEPVSSGELVRLCQEKLGWKRTTTYTVIKRLSERGIVKNENTVVTSLKSKEEIQDTELNELIKNRFDDSVPSFLAAFTRRQKLSEKEIDELQTLIDSLKKEGKS